MPAAGVRPNRERDKVIARERLHDKLTLREIGKRHGISRERVRQVVKAFIIEAYTDV